MTDEKINRLLSRRNNLLSRRDGLYDSAIIDRIDAQLRAVPEGTNNEVDLALGRPGAVLPPRVVMVQHIDGTQDIMPEFRRWSSDDQRAAWKTEAQAEIAPLAEAMTITYETWRDQTSDHDEFYGVDLATAEIEESPRDWADLRGDLAL